ncbi:hypothetical protein J5A71_10170 [Prevotella melaninogenica]|nr:hypothetical protein J5A72_12155 [Prevotella melaninogenica]QUB59084.1 hypothetical protein J5A71_10170 [Prevotella melaninogenica]
MKSMAVSVVCIFAILGIIYAINYLFYRFSPFHTLPSIKTLPVRSILGVFIALLGYFGAFPYFIIFNRGISLFNSGNMYIYLPIILTVLLVAVIVGIFRYEKRVWLRHNLKYSRLMLPSWNKGLKNLCVSISKIDDIAYGRGVSFSWFDGSFISAGRHRVVFEFYEDRYFSKGNTRNVIYKKEMDFNFRADTVYVIEVLQESQTFRITADTTRKNYL